MQRRRRQGRRVGEGPPERPPTLRASDGNILTKHHEGTNPLTMSYDAANRLTTSILGTTQLTTYTYSNAGEMAGERCDSLGIRATFVYDGEHRCVNEIRATTHSYTYAFDGLRRSAHMAGTANAVSFVWDGTDVLNEYVSGALSGRYLTLDGEVLSEKRGASRYVYGVDPLGSVVHLLDSGLNRAGTYVYWPYGEVQSHTGVDTPMQFVGRHGYYTSTTNRVYVRARWLRPDLARWLTEDPLGLAGGGPNVARYCASDPIGLVDFLGLSAKTCEFWTLKSHGHCDYRQNGVPKPPPHGHGDFTDHYRDHHPACSCELIASQCYMDVTIAWHGACFGGPMTMEVLGVTVLGSCGLIGNVGLEALDTVVGSAAAGAVYSFLFDSYDSGVPRHKGWYVNCRGETKFWYRKINCYQPEPGCCGPSIAPLPRCGRSPVYP